MSIPQDVLDVIRRIASHRGYRVESKGDTLRVWHESAPLYVEVVESSRGVLVRVGHENLRDYVREVVDTEADPRDYIEDILDSISSLAHEIYEELKRRGLKAVLDARTGVIDVLEELEEALEEE